MLRTSVLRLGASAAAAGAASRATQADARPRRPVSLPRATNTSETEKPTAPNEEDAWLEISLTDDGLVFGMDEIDESVKEIVGLVTEDSDATSNGEEADSVIDDFQPSVQSGTTLSHIMRASQRMKAAIEAIRNDATLRAMIEDLANCGLQPVDGDAPRIPFNEQDVPRLPSSGNARGRHRGNPMATMLEDISYHFSRLFSALAEAAGKLAKILRQCLSWLLNLVKEAGKAVKGLGKAILDTGKKVDAKTLELLPLGIRFLAEFGPAGKAAPIVVAGSMILIVYMIAKRAVA